MSDAPDAAIVAAAQWAAAAVAAWLAAGVLALMAARTRGPAARVGRIALRCYPWALKRLPIAVLAGAAGATVSPLPATAGQPPRPHRAVTGRAAPLDWPSLAGVITPHAASAAVVVRPGECLWQLAARDLGPDAPPAQVAAAWPRWWAANRRVIGPDPNLLRSGERLRRPSPTERTPG